MFCKLPVTFTIDVTVAAGGWHCRKQSVTVGSSSGSSAVAYVCAGAVVTGGGDCGSAKRDGDVGGVTQFGGGTVNRRCGGGTVRCQVAAVIYGGRNWQAADGASSSYYFHCHNKEVNKI